MSDGGKGSARRPGDNYQDNWERIFGKPKKSLRNMTEADFNDALGVTDNERAYDCPRCNTEMSITGTGLHWHCDVCGYNEAVVGDEP
jgi:rubrerythrin